MAKTFKNEAELKRFLMEKCKVAIENTQLTAMQDVNKQAVAFYNDYTPVMYERTGQLSGTPMTDANSFIQVSPVVSTGDGYQASVYLEADNLRYVTGGQPTGEQVLAAAIQGYHGAIGDIPNSEKKFKYVIVSGGEKIWDETLQAKATDDLIQELRAQGLPIKKK